MPLYLRAISNYAGSLAALHTGDTRNALLLQEELKLNAVNISNEVYQYRQGHAFYHNHYEMTQIMSIIVQSVVLVREKNFDAAILNLKIAVGIQDRFQYTEPEHFYLPVRHCLGAVYLGAHKSKRNLTLALTQRYLQNAENEYRKDLKQHPRNPWSVKGMYLVLDSYENKTKLLGFKKEYQSILSSRSYAATVAGFGGSCCELGFC